MQVFRPSDIDLEGTTAPARGFAGASAPGGVIARSAARLQSADGGLRSGVWESEAGTAEYVFSVDEWAYILEGEATVTASGATHVLRAGDVFYTPAGERMSMGCHRPCPQGLGASAAAASRTDQAQAGPLGRSRQVGPTGRPRAATMRACG